MNLTLKEILNKLAKSHNSCFRQPTENTFIESFGEYGSSGLPFWVGSEKSEPYFTFETLSPVYVSNIIGAIQHQLEKNSLILVSKKVSVGFQFSENQEVAKTGHIYEWQSEIRTDCFSEVVCDSEETYTSRFESVMNIYLKWIEGKE